MHHPPLPGGRTQAAYKQLQRSECLVPSRSRWPVRPLNPPPSRLNHRVSRPLPSPGPSAQREPRLQPHTHRTAHGLDRRSNQPFQFRLVQRRYSVVIKQLKCTIKQPTGSISKRGMSGKINIRFFMLSSSATACALVVVWFGGSSVFSLK